MRCAIFLQVRIAFFWSHGSNKMHACWFFYTNFSPPLPLTSSFPSLPPPPPSLKLLGWCIFYLDSHCVGSHVCYLFGFLTRVFLSHSRNIGVTSATFLVCLWNLFIPANPPAQIPTDPRDVRTREVPSLNCQCRTRLLICVNADFLMCVRLCNHRRKCFVNHLKPMFTAVTSLCLISAQ